MCEEVLNEFVLAVASLRVMSDTGPPSGGKFRSSKQSSLMAHSGTGFLFGLSTLLISKVIMWQRRIESLASAQKPRAGSTQTTKPPSHKECRWEHGTMFASQRSSCFLFLIRVVRVHKETVSYYYG